jgi:O-antigen/teichoic acid export membrane protein
MGLKQKVAKNTAISFLGKMTSSALGLVSIAFIARELGQDGFGNYNIVVAFLYIFSVFADFGLYNLLTREISKPGANEKKIVSNIFTSRIILLTFFYLLSFVVVVFIPSYSSEIKFGVLLTSLGFAFLSLSQVVMGVFQKYLKTMIPAIADVSARVVQLIFVLYLYQRGADFIDFLLIFVLGSFINFSIIYIFVKKYVAFEIKLNKSEFFNILKQGWPLAASSVLVLIYFKGDTLLLSFLRSSSDVGLYNVAYKIIENIIFFPAMFVGLVMPLLSKYFISDIQNFKKVFQKSFDFLNIISIPLIFGGYYLASDIIYLIGGSAFSEAVLSFKILIFSIFFIFLGALFGNAIIAMHKQKQVMLAYGAAAIFNILANIYMIKKYSYIGASIVSVATETLATTLMFFVIYKALRFIPKISILFKAFLAASFMVLIMWVFPIQNLFILLFIGVISYFICMYILKGVSKEDFIMFLKIKN